jgi:hypothetical protein
MRIRGTHAKGMTVDKHPTDAGPDRGDNETAAYQREQAADQREQAADQREQAADEREGALDVREYQVMAHVDAESERASRVQRILSAADERDEQAETRDDVSIKRYMAANLDAWLKDTDEEEADEARRLAWEDRTHSRRDRTASAQDRDHLAEETTRPPADTENG